MARTTIQVTIPGLRSRKLASSLLGCDPNHKTSEHTVSTTPNGVQVVCVSDTHNRRPEIPNGDILIHAGDLTENGSFDELQDGLRWLSAQPHLHKVYIAGNHDVLLDENFLDKYPARRYGDQRTAAALDWGDVIYLKDSSVTLNICKPLETPEQLAIPSQEKKMFKLTIYGTPWTPQYLASAFQYPRYEDYWHEKLPKDIDILVCHGPPRLYLDKAGAQHAGCPFLAKEIARIRPQLVVFGHIHAGYGVLATILNKPRKHHDEIFNNMHSHFTLAWMALAVLFNNIFALISSLTGHCRKERLTQFVNAAVVGGMSNELKNAPIIVKIDSRPSKRKTE